MTFRPARALLVSVVFILASVPRDARAWTWLPEGRATLVPLADPREPTLGFDVVEDGQWSARVGRSVVLGRTSPAGTDSSAAAALIAPPEGLEVGLDGFVWLWFSSLPRFNFPLETVDGSFAFWVGARHGRFAWRARLAHWSGHLGDGASDIEQRRIVYSRESIGVLGGWDANPHLRLYAGPALFVRASPSTQAFQFQAGGELRPGLHAVRPGRRTDPYLAVDLRMKAENDFRVNQSYQAGVRLTDGNGTRALRVHMGYAAGLSERGQEYQSTDDYVSLGLTFGD